MTNLQIIDTVNGGSFVFKDNDYKLDKGIYTELYCAFFTNRSADWLGQNAFGVETINVVSKTENAINRYSTFTEENLSLIKKAIESDLDRFAKKNKEIEHISYNVSVERGNKLIIQIFLNGSSSAYIFVVGKTTESLDNIKDFTAYTVSEDINILQSGEGNEGFLSGFNSAITY